MAVPHQADRAPAASGDVPVPGARAPLAGIIQSFLTGVVGILPLAMTLFVLVWIVSFLHDLLGPSSTCGLILRKAGMSVVACEINAYLVGALGALLSTYVLGVMIERGAGRRWSQTLEGVMARIPVLGTVYDASKQVTGVFDRSPQAQQNMTPVICYFGEGRSVWTPALMPTTESVRLNGVDYRVVMIPTAPVPFGGALLCVRAELVLPAPCGIEELVAIYMSMGVSAPRTFRDKGEPSDHLPAATGETVETDPPEPHNQGPTQ